MSGSYENGPYIPVEHEQYDLLPRCRAEGGEVFSYPSMLDDVDERIRKWEARRVGVQVDEHDARHENDLVRIMPYGMKSYAEYYGMLERYAVDIAPVDPQLAQDIRTLKDLMKLMNVKEQWSIVRYVGDQFDEVEGLGLTRGGVAITGRVQSHVQSTRVLSMMKNSRRIFIHVTPIAGRSYAILPVWRCGR